MAFLAQGFRISLAHACEVDRFVTTVMHELRIWDSVKRGKDLFPNRPLPCPVIGPKRVFVPLGVFPEAEAEQIVLVGAGDAFDVKIDRSAEGGHRFHVEDVYLLLANGEGFEPMVVPVGHERVDRTWGRMRPVLAPWPVGVGELTD